MSTPPPTSRLNRFIAELRRRHVGRVALAYAAVVFVLLQLSEIVLPAFLTNPQADFVVRVVVVGAVLFFPVVLAMAWIYEITPKGVRSMVELDAESGFQTSVGAFAPRFAFLAVTIVAATASGIWWWRTAEIEGPGFNRAGPSDFQAATATDASGPIRSLAVLPLEDTSPSTDDAWFATSMHEALVNGVGQISSLRTLSRTSTLRYDQQGRSLAQIGADLNVDALVEGSVLVVEGQVQISVRMYHAASETQIWQQDYRRDLVDVLSLQEEVAAAIAQEIGLQIDASVYGGPRTASSDLEESPAIEAPDLDQESEGDAEPGLYTPPAVTRPATPPSPEAASNYLQGRNLLVSGEPTDASTAREFFTDALEVDSAYAPALTGLAGSELVLALDDATPEREVERLVAAREYAVRALGYEPENEEARDVLAAIDERLIVSGGRIAARELGEAFGGGIEVFTDSTFRMAEDGRTMVLPSGDSVQFEFGFESMAPVMTTLGQVMQENLGRVVRMERQASGANPMDDALRTMLRFAVAGDLGEAIDVGEDFVESGVPDWRVYETLEQLYRMDDELEEVGWVRERRAEVLGPEPGPSWQEFAVAGDESEVAYSALKQDEYAARLEAGAPVLHVFHGALAASAGDHAEALEYLRMGIEARESAVATLRLDPAWDDLRSTDEYRAAMRSMRRDGPAPRGPGFDGRL